MSEKAAGQLLVIGGAEDKEGRCTILRRFVAMAGEEKARLVVLTLAASAPGEVGAVYESVFHRLGVARVEVLHMREREEARLLAPVLEEASGVFFTGGDQLRISTLLGGTMLEEALRRAWQRGVPVAGTSAGASAMSHTMIVGGEGEEAPRRDALQMAPGLGLLQQVVVDQHFSQRGRLGRLLAAVGQNPAILGLGLDEDTAALIEGDLLEVVGSGAATLVDGRAITHTSVSGADPGRPLALANVLLHLLPAGYRFNLSTRHPLPPR